MRIITADETGLVKVARLESGECLAVSSGEQARSRAVRAICHNDTFQGHQDSKYCGSIHVARSGGAVETWDISQSDREGISGSSSTLSRRKLVIECSPSPVILESLRTATAGNSESSRVLTCNTDGQVQLSSVGETEKSDKGDTPVLSTFSIRGPVSAATVLYGSSKSGSASLAAGGQENDLKIWDVNTAQCTWKAKNVPHDFLDLRQPVWVSSLRSLTPDVDKGGGTGGPQQIVAGTAHRQVRLYDARAQTRPTHSVDADEHGITTMAVSPDAKEVVVADTAGLVRVLDLRTMKWGRRFEGPAGSVRGLAFHPTLPVLACVGLDRMARVFDYRSREQKFQVYLKQRLNAVLFDGEGEVRIAGGVGSTEHGSMKGNAQDAGEEPSEDEVWGSGEEYEMDEMDTSADEDEDEQERLDANGSGGRGLRAKSARVQRSQSSSSDDDDEGIESSEDGGEAESSDAESESDEEVAPPKRVKAFKSTRLNTSKKIKR